MSAAYQNLAPRSTPTRTHSHTIRAQSMRISAVSHRRSTLIFNRRHAAHG